MQELVRLLGIPSQKRTPDVISRIARLTSNAKYFCEIKLKNPSNDLHRSCCAAMTLERYAAGEDIIVYGTVGYAFYIILKGKVSVSVLTTKINLDGEVQRVMKEVNILEEGSNFGELALVNDRPRAATITAIEPVVVAVLTKEDFNSILADLSKKSLNEVYVFFRSIPAFKLYTKDCLYKLSYYSTVLTFNRNQAVFKENDPANYLYFIKRGEVKLSRRIKILSKPIVVNTENTKSVNVYKRLDLCFKGVNEILGLDEIINKNTTHIYSCVCVSRDAELLRISHNDFLLKIPHSDTWNMLKHKQVEENKRLNNLYELSRNIEHTKDSLLLTSQKKPKVKKNNKSVVHLRRSHSTPKVPKCNQIREIFPRAKISPFHAEIATRSFSIFKKIKKPICITRKSGPPASFYHKMSQQLKDRYNNVSNKIKIVSND